MQAPSTVYSVLLDPSVLTRAVDEWIQHLNGSPKQGFSLPASYRPLRTTRCVTCLWLVAGGPTKSGAAPFVSEEVFVEAANRLLNIGFSRTFVTLLGDWLDREAVIRPHRVVPITTRQPPSTVRSALLPMIQVVKACKPIMVVSVQDVSFREDCAVATPKKFVRAVNPNW